MQNHPRWSWCGSFSIFDFRPSFMKKKSVKIEIFCLHENGPWTHTWVYAWHFEKEKVSNFCGNHVYASLKRSHKHWQMMQPKETKRFSSLFSPGLFLKPRFLLLMFTEMSQVSFYSCGNLCDIWCDCQTPSLRRISVWNLQNLNFCRRCLPNSSAVSIYP